jgi:hypothetical protein
MIYIPSFAEIGSGVQKLLGEYIHMHADLSTHRQQGDLICLFFKIRKVLKINSLNRVVSFLFRFLLFVGFLSTYNGALLHAHNSQLIQH